MMRPSIAMLPSPQDPKQEIQKVMKFMEKNLDGAVLDTIVQETTFEKMKAKAVGKSDACRHAWNICRFSRFFKSSQGRGRGRGHIGQS